MEIKAPNEYFTDYIDKDFTVFLGGAIDQGRAVNWQEQIARTLDPFDILVLNPRRDNWNDKVEQSIECEEFRQQVHWELSAQESANLCIYMFPKDSKAPITFFELGFFLAKHKKVLVCVEEGFYRRGNIEIVCERYNVPLFKTLEELSTELVKRVKEAL